MPTTYDRIAAILKQRGWVCIDEVFRYRRSGRLVPFDRIMRAMPEDILEDVVAAYGESTRAPIRTAKPARRPRRVQ